MLPDTDAEPHVLETQVLTKLDLLDKQGSDNACAGFSSTLVQISSPQCFAILGNVESSADETAKLQRLSFYSPNSDKMVWGVRDLNVYLEAKITEHLDAQLPTLRGNAGAGAGA